MKLRVTCWILICSLVALCIWLWCDARQTQICTDACKKHFVPSVGQKVIGLVKNIEGKDICVCYQKKTRGSLMKETK